tara:strand:- start:10561 stop:11502 length:942 start_codon:yes stop_codon:yes gene_type:complete
MNSLSERHKPGQRVAAVIVTYNRLNDLKTSVDALLYQTTPPDHIIVINNNSPDNTAEFLLSSKRTIGDSFHYLNLQHNVGGAGGFKKGMEIALELDIDRIWLLDDDGIAHKNALQQLKLASFNSDDTFSSTAICKDDKNSLCWPPSRKTTSLNTLNQITETNFAPFLGFFIHIATIEKIGTPYAEYFISGDDHEYSKRITNLGLKIYWVKSSIVIHPRPSRLEIRIGKFSFRHLLLPEPRITLDTRNRIWTAKIHGSSRRVVLVTLSIVAHLILHLAYTGNINALGAYLKGIYHGISKPTNFDKSLKNNSLQK